MNRRLFFLGGAAVAGRLSISPAIGQLTQHDLDVIKKENEDEKLALQKSENDPSITVGFERLAKDQELDLQKIRKSIFGTENVNTDQIFRDPAKFLGQLFQGYIPVYRGSGILLDREGTLVLSAHQVRGSHTSVHFNPAPNFVCVTSANIISDGIDSKLDIAFAKLTDPAVIEKYGLTPIEWGQTDENVNDQQPKNRQPNVCVGFPSSLNLLHATRGWIVLYKNEIKLLDEYRPEIQPWPSTCKYASSALIEHGESGGGVFGKGKLLGLINAKHTIRDELNSGTFFTPVEAIQDAYARLFRSDLTASNAIAQRLARHRECVLNR